MNIQKIQEVAKYYIKRAIKRHSNFDWLHDNKKIASTIGLELSELEALIITKHKGGVTLCAINEKHVSKTIAEISENITLFYDCLYFSAGKIDGEFYFYMQDENLTGAPVIVPIEKEVELINIIEEKGVSFEMIEGNPVPLDEFIRGIYKRCEINKVAAQKWIEVREY